MSSGAVRSHDLNHDYEQSTDAVSETKLTEFYIDSCSNVDASHSVHEEDVQRDGRRHLKKERATSKTPGCERSKAKRSLSSTLHSSESPQRQNRNLSFSASKVKQRNNTVSHKQGKCVLPVIEGLKKESSSCTKAKPQLAIDLTLKSKIGNKNLRRNRSQRLKRSRTFQSKREVHELLYTGLVTPSRTQYNWKSLPPGVHYVASDNAFGDGTDELEISDIPRSGCGTPWSWSKNQNRRRYTRLWLAGTGMSCRVSNSLPKKGARSFFHDSSSSSNSFSVSTDGTESSFNTGSDSLPLLNASSSMKDSGSQSEYTSCKQHVNEHRLPDPSSIHGRQLEITGEDDMPATIVPTSHHSLNEKYMPKTFQDVRGQNLVTQALCNALSKGKIAPMYIFHGPRGTGKTTCAKVFVAALNCISTEGLRPCGVCMECESGERSKDREYNIGGKNSTRGIKKLMHDVIWSSSEHYSAYIVDECHTLTKQSWAALLKVVEEAPRNAVFILLSSSLERLPHEIVSRCQKFLFSKIKENEIFAKLNSIAIQEGMEADTDAIQLIASTSDGSLRDAEMMLDQLNLLGQRITVTIVQELMGLIPNDKLLELLDFALSADTVNTVRNLKELLVSGAEPLNLMSQLACLITSILAGGFHMPIHKKNRKFFQPELSKQAMETLRQALKTLSHAEKQLRDSSDRTTWLTAALLQLAPDQSYVLSRSMSNTPSVVDAADGPSDINGTPDLGSTYSKRRSKTHLKHYNPGRFESVPDATVEHALDEMSDSSVKSLASSRTLSKGMQCQQNGLHCKANESKILWSSPQVDDTGGNANVHITTLANQFDMEDVWQRFLDTIHSSSLREFLIAHGRLVSLSLSKGFAVVHLEFEQSEHMSRAVHSRTSIAYAFQCALGYPIDIRLCLAPEVHECLERQASFKGNKFDAESLWYFPWNSRTNLKDCKVTEDENSQTPLVSNTSRLNMSPAYSLKLHQKSDGCRPILSFGKVEPNFLRSSSSQPEKPPRTIKKKHVDTTYKPRKDDECEPKHEEPSTLNIFRNGGSEMGYAMAQEVNPSGRLALQQLDDDTMKLESKTGSSWWNEGGSTSGCNNAKV
ncbi:hypothetical protein KP509_05G098800 [Ceratopteris richardii]|uniref:AAA+ ATPase domain-containing protein n=1 Tax=Ceratopteris richardii TaxID=49495 RepID=A0A8T2URM4_CERRI|nr:hypothetical protein KP509_05G098800 [Ceratopteris richardii]